MSDSKTYKVNLIGSERNKDTVITYHGEDGIFMYSFTTGEILAQCKVNKNGDTKDEWTDKKG